MRLHCHCPGAEKLEAYHWLVIAQEWRIVICEKSVLFYENWALNLKTSCEVVSPQWSLSSVSSNTFLWGKSLGLRREHIASRRSAVSGLGIDRG